jgi:hypothetical protein
MSDKSINTKDTNVVLWIIVVFLIASLLGSIGILVWLNARKPRTVAQPASTSTPPVPARASGKAPTSFAEIAEADVPGRYKITDPNKVSYIVLNDDHTFINEDGTTYAPYRWDVSPDGLTIVWQRNSTTWNVFEAPGVYLRTKSDGTTSRMEKLPDLPPADTISINDKDVMASIIFAATIQTNGLSPANTEADGAIFPGEAGGQECYQLIRNRSRMSAFLYVRIAPELKTEPFTNALLTIEYFDSPARDLRNGWLSLQYDGRDGPYTSTAQRVKLEGTMKWTHATFVLDAPLFNGARNGQADFRLCVAGPDLSIRAIKLVKNKPVK